jgi:hypothetical protein
MSDYSEFSDFEVNKRVAKCLGFQLWKAQDDLRESVLVSKDCQHHCFDYCNNPADAWPIITGNCIDLTFDTRGNCHASAIDVLEHCDPNPLRAACIVYLMMKEAE